jgi:hypothetical protein
MKKLNNNMTGWKKAWKIEQLLLDLLSNNIVHEPLVRVLPNALKPPIFASDDAANNVQARVCED